MMNVTQFFVVIILISTVNSINLKTEYHTVFFFFGHFLLSTEASTLIKNMNITRCV